VLEPTESERAIPISGTGDDEVIALRKRKNQEPKRVDAVVRSEGESERKDVGTMFVSLLFQPGRSLGCCKVFVLTLKGPTEEGVLVPLVAQINQPQVRDSTT